MRMPAAAVALILCLAPVRAQQARNPAPSREPEFRKAISQAWEKLATWCAEKKLRAEARAAAAEALEADSANAKAQAARAEGDSEGTEADRKEYASKLAATRKLASGLWRQLATQPHAAKEDPVYDGYWARALATDPKAMQPLYDAEWRTAIQKSDWKRAALLISQETSILGPDPARAKALRDVEMKFTPTEPVLKKASRHELRYFFSLPKGWTPDRKVPVLVVVEGAGCGFEGQCKRHMGFRGDVPVIIVTPCTFANTNGLNKDKYPWYPQSLLDEVERTGRLKFDDEGLMNVLEDVRRDYNAEEKFFITGYSGGGNLTWWNVFTRPAQLLGAFPACANFYAKPNDPPEGGRDVPVRAFQGDKDGHLEMLNGQWAAAEALLKQWGYTNFSRKLLPGVGHTACHAEVYAAIKEILQIK